MLRLYKPIKHDIFKLQDMLEHLVCQVWCEAGNETCESKLNPDFKLLYNSYGWLKKEVDEIYDACKPLSKNDRNKIRTGFITNNSVKDLCNGQTPVYLNEMPGQVETFIKPLLVDFYESLLDKAKVPGTKKDYYEKLIQENDFQYCPACGLTDFEHEDSARREAFDHYLPKSEYPFASINFSNLVPLCYKCNSDRKKAKDPIENDREAFFPFSKEPHNIGISVTINPDKILDKLNFEDVIFSFKGDQNKIETWDWLFGISERYNNSTRGFTKSFLRKIKRRHDDFQSNSSNKQWTYIDSLNKIINDYEYDKYEDKKFLKIPFMIELKNHPALIKVYE